VCEIKNTIILNRVTIQNDVIIQMWPLLTVKYNKKFRDFLDKFTSP